MGDTGFTVIYTYIGHNLGLTKQLFPIDEVHDHRKNEWQNILSRTGRVNKTVGLTYVNRCVFTHTHSKTLQPLKILSSL